MAKNRRDDFIDEPGPVPGLVELPDPEKEALRSEIERLKALLAKQPAAPALVNAPQGNVGDYWAVCLKHAPTHVVRAVDPANAWEAYRAELGVRSSENVPEVVPSDREAYRASQAKRYGKRPDEWRLPDDPTEDDAAT